MRLVLLSLVLLGSGVGLVPVAVMDSADLARVDPIVTGHSIPDEHKIAWDERRKAWDACETCFVEQEFPGEG